MSAMVICVNSSVFGVNMRKCLEFFLLVLFDLNDLFVVRCVVVLCYLFSGEFFIVDLGVFGSVSLSVTGLTSGFYFWS